jgi:Cys-rich four helix bundle protein (predicted Tat secretion target)
MKRREFVQTAALSAASLSAFAAGLGTAWADDHDKHDKHDKEHKASGTVVLAASGLNKKKLREVVEEALDCIEEGENCLAHCAQAMSQGDATVAECQMATLNMLAVCRAMVSVASYDTLKADQLRQFLNFCADVCESCAKTCEPHAKHRKECKECMQACRACAKACRAAV